MRAKLSDGYGWKLRDSRTLVAVLVILSVFALLSGFELASSDGAHGLGHGYCPAHGSAAVLVSSVSLPMATPVELMRPSDAPDRSSSLVRSIFIPPRV